MNKLTVNKGLMWGILCLSLGLVACSSNDQYLDAKTLPVIVVPDVLDNQALGQIYVVPDGDGRVAAGEFKNPLPPTLSVSPVVADPVIQSFANESWLVIPKEASATWSQLIIFLQSRQISSVKQDPFSASIETDWITERADPGRAYRYRLHLEAGLQPELTELHAVNIEGRQNSLIDTSAQWKSTSDNTSHQLWFLKEIAKGMSVQRSLADSLIASSISFPEKVVSTSADGEPVIELSLSKERTYDLLQTHSQNKLFVTYDANEAQGILYIDNNKNKSKDDKSNADKLKSTVEGFINSLGSVEARDTGNSSGQVSKYRLDDLLANLPNDPAVNALFPRELNNTERKLLSRVNGYLLVQKTVADKQRIYIRDGYGQPLEPSVAKGLLDTIKKQWF